MKTVKSEQVAKFRKSEIVKDYNRFGGASYRLLYDGRLVCQDRSFRYLNQIMYQIG